MIKDMFLNLIYPRRCPVCDNVMAQGAGFTCETHDKLPYAGYPACLKCGKEIADSSQEYCYDCKTHARHFTRGFPVFNYTEPIKSSVLSIKYKDRREYCDFYAEEMKKKLLPYLEFIRLDAIIPVPMHKKKKKERGFNQTEILSVKLGQKLRLPVYTDILLRDRMTTPQKSLNHIERANNIKNAIRLQRVPYGIEHILLVDDIYTTGITIDTCSSLLISAGVKNVYFTTICIGNGF